VQVLKAVSRLVYERAVHSTASTASAARRDHLWKRSCWHDSYLTVWSLPEEWLYWIVVPLLRVGRSILPVAMD
jgi:hypothetical protein